MATCQKGTGHLHRAADSPRWVFLGVLPQQASAFPRPWGALRQVEAPPCSALQINTPKGEL